MISKIFIGLSGRRVSESGVLSLKCSGDQPHYGPGVGEHLRCGLEEDEQMAFLHCCERLRAGLGPLGDHVAMLALAWDAPFSSGSHFLSSFLMLGLRC